MKFLVLMAERDHFDNWEKADDVLRKRVVGDFQAFTAAVRGETPMRTGPNDAVATAELIDQCYRAAGLPLRPRAALDEGRS